MTVKRISALTVLLLILCVLAGCSGTGKETAACAHEWENATCTAAQTCRLCNETVGEPLEHNWEEATCQEPKHCAVCNLTEGKALDHQWSALTCEENYTCTVCNAASGVQGPHVDVKNITQDPENNLLVQCKCGHEEIMTIENLMLQLAHGKWTLRAVLKDNSLLRPDPTANWQEGTWLEFPTTAEPTAYEIGTSAQGENFAFQMNLLDFQLNTAALYANGPKLAVLMCTARTEYSKDVHTDVPLILVFGDRNYAAEGMSDDDFISAALKGTVTSLWRQSDGVMYIYGFDMG